MSLYDVNGEKIQVSSVPFKANVTNSGYVTTPNSFFVTEKSVTGNGTTKFLQLTAIGYPNTKIATFITYFGAKVKCSKDCTIRLFNSNSISENIIYSKGNAYTTQRREGTITTVKAKADEEYFLYGIIGKTTTTAGASRGFAVTAEFDEVSDTNGVTLTVSKGVCFDVTEIFGSGYELDADTIHILLSQCEDFYFTKEINLWNEEKVLLALKNRRELDSRFYDSYMRLSQDKGVEIGGAINPNWENWQYTQYNYGNNANLCPIPTMFHGKIMTDAQVSVIPLYGHWGKDAVTVGSGDWGGHVFHGWNDAQTYRLTMMASGGMTGGTVEDFVKREDEFCLHVFSPTGAYKNPIGLTESEANNRIIQEQEDIFSGSAYYGRLRIGADKADEGFLFRSKSLTCFGRLDVNGQKFILGDQSANIPAASNSKGVKGQVAYDENYMYVCIDTNTWKRFALETW